MTIVYQFPLGSTPGYSPPQALEDIGAPGVLAFTELALDPATGDLATPIRFLRGAYAIVQRLVVRFHFFLGEWFLDQRQGVPYFQSVLVKNADPVVISSVFRRVLTTTPGVRSVTRFRASLDRPTRTLAVDFEASLLDGTLLTFDQQPFIL